MYIANTLWQMKLANGFTNFIKRIYFKTFSGLVCKLHSCNQTFFYLNLNFTTFKEVNISYFQWNSCEHIDEIIHDVRSFRQYKFQTDIITRNL